MSSAFSLTLNTLDNDIKRYNKEATNIDKIDNMEEKEDLMA